MYNLVIGAIAQLQILAGSRGCIAPERLAETARPAGWQGPGRARREGPVQVARRHGSQNGLDRTGNPPGERLLRELHLEAETRVLEWRNLPLYGRSARAG